MPAAQTFMTGLGLGESPRWHEGRLWFADWLAGRVVAVDLDGRREDVLALAGFPFSIDWLPDGRLVVVSSADAAVLRREADGSVAVHADLAPLAAPSWNEIVVAGGDDRRAHVYVNTIGFDMATGEDDACGSIAVVGPDGAVRGVAEGLRFPNGMAVTADGATLVVAESYAGRLTAFDIGPDGSLGRRRVWADLGDGAPDGICLDAEGAVWYADVPHRRCVRVREGGDVLAAVGFDRGCFACALGGDDGRTLYVTTADWQGLAGLGSDRPSGRVMALRVPVPGAGRARRDK